MKLLILCLMINMMTFPIIGYQVGQIIYDENQKLNDGVMAVILQTQFDLDSTLSHMCDINVFKQYHSNPVCLSKTSVVSPIDTGFILHGNTTSGIMWEEDNDEHTYQKMKGSNYSEQKYIGNLRLVQIDGMDYYLITDTSMQEDKR